MEPDQSLPAGEQYTEQPLNAQQAGVQNQSIQQHQLVTELIMVNMAEFLSMDLPERGFLLELLSRPKAL